MLYAIFTEDNQFCYVLDTDIITHTTPEDYTKDLKKDGFQVFEAPKTLTGAVSCYKFSIDKGALKSTYDIDLYQKKLNDLKKQLQEQLKNETGFPLTFIIDNDIIEYPMNDKTERDFAITLQNCKKNEYMFNLGRSRVIAIPKKEIEIAYAYLVQMIGIRGFIKKDIKEKIKKSQNLEELSKINIKAEVSSAMVTEWSKRYTPKSFLSLLFSDHYKPVYFVSMEAEYTKHIGK